MFLSFLCNTRSSEGKHSEETYCEAAEGSHGEPLFVRKSRGLQSQRCANRIKSQSSQIPMSASNYIKEKRVAGCERRNSGRMVGNGKQSRQLAALFFPLESLTNR